MHNFLKYLREQVSQGVRNYFAPLRHWRQFVGFLIMVSLMFVPFHGWLTSGGYASFDDLSTVLGLSFYITLTLLAPLYVLMFIRVYPGFKRYSWGILAGAVTNVVLMVTVISGSPIVGANDGLIIVDGGVKTVVAHDDVRRYAPWDDREFISVENAYGDLETKTYKPCQQTLCATVVKVKYGFSEPFIAANADNTTNYEAVVNLALIDAVNIQGYTNVDDIAPAMCTHIKGSLGLDADSACPVTLEFSAQVDSVK